MTRKRITTEEFIAGLAISPVPTAFAAAPMVLLFLAVTALGAAVWIVLMGLRPDIGSALLEPVTLAKTLLTALLSGCALWLAIRSARPGVRPGLPLLLAPLPVAAVLVALAVADTQVPLLAPTLIGGTALKCLSAVTALSLLPIVTGLVFLKDGASTSPARTGALLGLAAGAGAAAGYSLACTEDSPLFYVTWYGLAIIAAGGIGALAGWRLLRW